MSFQKSIDSVLDTPNVEGLLLFDLDGLVRFEQAPDYTDRVMLEKLPQRVLTMYDIIADNVQNCSDLILKFEKKNIYFRKSSGKQGKNFVLAVIGNSGVNFISLKLVTNLAMRMIELDDINQTTKIDSKKSRYGLTYRGQKLAGKKKSR